MNKLPEVKPRVVKVKFEGGEVEFRNIRVPEFEFVTQIEANDIEAKAVLANKDLSESDRKVKLKELQTLQIPLLKSLLASTLYVDAEDSERMDFIDSLTIADFWKCYREVLIVSGLKDEEVESAIKQAANDLNKQMPKKKSLASKSSTHGSRM